MTSSLLCSGASSKSCSPSISLIPTKGPRSPSLSKPSSNLSSSWCSLLRFLRFGLVNFDACGTKTDAGIVFWRGDFRGDVLSTVAEATPEHFERVLEAGVSSALLSEAGVEVSAALVDCSGVWVPVFVMVQKFLLWGGQQKYVATLCLQRKKRTNAARYNPNISM